MKKKQAPNARQAETCTSCKNAAFLAGKRQMVCKKYEVYVLADSVCDDYEAILKGWFNEVVDPLRCFD